MPLAPLRVFVSYSHDDSSLREELRKHLAGLTRQGQLVVWDDAAIQPGATWNDEIWRQLDAAHLVLLLVSASFLASDFAQREMGRALQRRDAEGVAVLPIVVRPCHFGGSPIDGIQMLPPDAKPVTSWRDRDEAWTAVVKGLRTVLDSLSNKPPQTANAAAPNPYDPWRPAVPPRFAGRIDLLRALADALDDGRSLSLVGDSRMGKRSLLQTWAEKAKSRGREVRLAAGDEAADPGALVASITGKTAPSDPDAASDALNAWASQVAPKGLPPLVLVSRFDKVVERFPMAFFERMRALLDRHALSLVLASRLNLDDLFAARGRSSPFTSHVQVLRIGLLDEDATGEVLSWSQGVLDAEDERLIRAWAGRHPYFLQLLARHLVDAHTQGQTRDDALRRARTEADSRIKAVWMALSEREQLTLKELAGGRVRTGLVVDRLIDRGLVDEKRQVFGQALTEWVEELA